MPPLHVVTDDAVLARPDFADRAHAVLKAGGPDVALHLRGPHTSGGVLFALADALVRSAPSADLVMNDRVDIARALGLSVHLGGRSLSVEDTRRILPLTRVGRSCGPERAEHADAAQADYRFLGPVFATATHPGRPALDADRLAELASEAPSPWVGIGGISVDRIGVLKRAGASGMAVIRAVWDAPDPAKATQELLEAWRAAEAPLPSHSTDVPSS